MGVGISFARDAALAGAHRVLRECLSLEAGQVVAVFFDETTRACAELFERAAAEQELIYLGQFVPVDVQRALSVSKELAPEHEAVINDARAIVACLTDALDTTPFRRRLLDLGVDEARYMGTMPGATPHVLASTINIDYAAAREKCEDLAVALLSGERAILTTFELDAKGSVLRQHVLEMDLGGFERPPVTSTGIIPRGTWGNLPAGETFIAPIEGTARGTFVINGAYTGQVMAPGESLLLQFDNGVLDRLEGHDHLRQRFATMLESAWTAASLGLAELGIGVNDQIRELTGCALFDEKMAGTIHVALGENRSFGGNLASPVHEDVITVGPSLSVDGKAIIECGRLVFRNEEWRETLKDAEAAAASLPASLQISRTAVGAEVTLDGRLAVHRTVGAKRLCQYSLGEPALSRLAGSIYQQLPEVGSIYLARLLSQLSEAGSHEQVRGTLNILAKHKLVHFSPAVNEHEEDV